MTDEHAKDGRGAEGPVVAFGGDVILGGRQNALTARHGPERALAGVPELAAAYLAIVNLEGVVATGGEPVAKPGPVPFHFRGRPELLAVLAAAGVDLVATANNHSLDYGPDALLEQIALLDGMGLGHAGAGPTPDAACAPVLRRAGNLVVALFSVDATSPRLAATAGRPGTCYLAPDDPTAWRRFFAPRIAAARESAHVVLVAVHIGVAHVVAPGPRGHAIGRATIDAGADAVLGSSAHLLQGIEVYRGRPIVHDAGNLLGHHPRRLSASAVFSLVLAPGGIREVWATPVEVGYGESRAATGERGRAILNTLTERSRAFGTALDEQEGRAVLELPAPPPRRPPSRVPPANPPLGDPPAPRTEPPPGCVVSEVPPAARIDPIRVGPLTLLGVSTAPDILTERSPLWLETFWSLDEPTPTDYWIAASGKPTGRHDRGWHGDHEPCDWQWPTSRWKPGEIHRDRSALRPPRRVPAAGDVVVSIGLLDGERPVGEERDIARIPLVLANPSSGPPPGRERRRARNRADRSAAG